MTPNRHAVSRTLFAALFLGAVAALPLPALAQQDTVRPPSIGVNGDGEVRRTPDEASVRLGVVAQADTAGEAQQQANRIAGGILAAVRELGIEERAIQTSRLDLSPVYSNPGPRPIENPEDYTPKIVAYRASNTVSVRLADLAKVGPVIDAGIGAGSNQVEGVDFRLRDDTEARAEALRLAVENARRDAQAIATALGVALGPVLFADEGGVNIEYPRFEKVAYARDMAQSMAPTPVAPGDVTVRANVTVRYSIGR